MVLEDARICLFILFCSLVSLLEKIKFDKLQWHSFIQFLELHVF